MLFDDHSMTLAHFSALCHVGRLIEWRLDSIDQLSDMYGLERARAQAVKQGGPEVVICVDWRLGEVLRPELADALTQSWHKRAIGFQRSAILLSKDRPTFNLQIERVIRAVDVATRRSFSEAPALLTWLGEVLTVEELHRAADFLNEPAR
jgi:hypothetical protein